LSTYIEQLGVDYPQQRLSCRSRLRESSLKTQKEGHVDRATFLFPECRASFSGMATDPQQPNLATEAVADSPWHQSARN